MRLAQRAAVLATLAGLAASLSFANTITFGFDSATGKNYVTQTASFSGTLNVNSGAAVFTFLNFASLGLTNATYVVGNSTFDFKFANTVTNFTVTNNDLTADSIDASIQSKLSVDPGSTLPVGASLPVNDYKRAGQALGFTFSGNTPSQQIITLADTGTINLNPGQTYTYPTLPVTFSNGIGLSNCSTFGDISTTSGCALLLKQDATYSGSGSVAYGIFDLGGFGFTALGGSGNPNLSFAGNTNFSSQAEITYEYTVSAPSVPEPATLALMGGALVGLALFGKRMKKS